MTHPYRNLPASKFWKEFVTDTPWRELKLNIDPKFIIRKEDKVITAGSCFAQHISRYMRKVGLEIFNAEPPHELMTQYGANTDSYTQYSARYGNVYTSRQCLELLKQSIGEMATVEDFAEEDGRWFDLLRPNITKKGFSSLNEAKADRRFHLTCVNKMFAQADIFIFTLGLTECWFNSVGGHTYSSCPGTIRGIFNPDLHLFRNLNFSDIECDLMSLLNYLNKHNEKLKIILTVSPIPLVATYTNQDVLLASSYSKSVLRAVAGDLQSRFENVAYFPSYEIVNHVASFGQYLSGDLREVSERGIKHVMECFLETFCGNAYPNMSTHDMKTVQNANSLSFSPPALCDEIYNSPRN
jgi:hypothetical protein